MEKTYKNIKLLREKRGFSQTELAHKVGYKDKSSISKIEAGSVDLSQSRIAMFARVLGVTPAELMGIGSEIEQDYLPTNVVAVPELKKVPLVGQIACGTPILAEQNIEDYIDLPHHIRADYALTCKGDSMIGAGVHDGDVVYIRKQAQVDNGQIAAVLVDSEDATLKRFYFDGKATVTLTAENPAVPPMVFAGEDVERIRVIGLAVAFTHSLV